MSEIVASWTNAGVPLVAPANVPEVTIRRIDTQAIVAGPSAMTEIGEGSFAFTFAPVATLEYAIVADGDPLAAGQVLTLDRYQYGFLSGIDEARIQTDIPAILVDTGTTIPALIAALNDLSIADVQTALTNQGYTAARALLLDNLDATISSRATQVSVDTIDAIVDDLLAALVTQETTAAAGSTSTEVRTPLTQADGFFDEAVIVVVNSAGTAARHVVGYLNTNGAFSIDADNPLPFTPAASDPVYVLPADHFARTTIRKIETNRWRIDTTAFTLTFFNDDGTTPLFVFDLLDAAAAPSTDDVFERDPV